MSKNSDVVDFEIKGSDMQLVEVELDPQETVIAEAGVMNYMDAGITFEAKMGDGSDTESGFFGNLFKAGKRMVTGESLFLTHFTNEGTGKKRIAFSGAYPGKIIPLDLNDGDVICQKSAFLCAARGTSVDLHLNKKIGAGFFGGEGFIMQKIEGDGMAFLHAGGYIVERELKNEKILIDTGCVVGYRGDISMDIERAGGLKTMLFGGEGIFLSTLEGTGTVWIQSLPLSRLAANISYCSGSASGGNGIVDKITNIID